MADNKSQSTQQSAEAAVARITNAGAKTGAPTTQAQVAEAAQNPPTTPWNHSIPAPPNGGKK